MRDKIENILSQMAKGECDPEETVESLLVLLDVRESLVNHLFNDPNVSQPLDEKTIDSILKYINSL